MSVERVEGYQPATPRERPFGHVNTVGTDYFRTLGMQVLKGRAFDDNDRAGTARTLVINEAFAKRYFRAPIRLANASTNTDPMAAYPPKSSASSKPRGCAG